MKKYYIVTCNEGRSVFFKVMPDNDKSKVGQVFLANEKKFLPIEYFSRFVETTKEHYNRVWSSYIQRF